MIGVEELSGYTFNLDLTFKRSALIQKGFDLYYSGKEFINSFSYSEWPQVYVYGAKRFAEKRHKMHFRIEHFDPATDTIRISFYGETIMNNGRKIKIDGITTALLNRAE